MRTFVPDYYNKFRCLAGDCRHSCCIGWEIDIDEETLEYYRSVEGEFGERLKNSISYGETPHFCMGKDGRCPFLNEKGLCDIMTELGFDKVSQICDDHPRFRNFYSDRTEIGLGMSCEAVAQLILSNKDRTELVCIEDGEECLWPEEWDFIDLRQQVFDTLQNREKPVEERMADILTLCGAPLVEKDMSYWAEEFKKLERLDDNWTDMLDDMKNIRQLELPVDNVYETAVEQLLVYFSFRHLADSLDDNMLAARRRFVVLSVMVITAMWQCHKEKYAGIEFDCMADICRMYSSEIEYSTENIDSLLNLLNR